MAPPRGDRLEGDLGLVTRGPAARAVPRFALLLAPVTVATFSSEASLMMCICSLKRSSVQRSRMTASPADSSHACHWLLLAKRPTSTKCQHVQQAQLNWLRVPRTGVFGSATYRPNGSRYVHSLWQCTIAYEASAAIPTMPVKSVVRHSTLWAKCNSLPATARHQS